MILAAIVAKPQLHGARPDRTRLAVDRQRGQRRPALTAPQRLGGP